MELAGRGGNSIAEDKGGDFLSGVPLALQASSFNPVSTTEIGSLNAPSVGTTAPPTRQMSERNIQLTVTHGLFAHCPITCDKIKKLGLRRCF